MPHREQRVTWADQSEGAPLALDETAFRVQDTDEQVGAFFSADDVNGVLEHDREWSPPPSLWELPTRRTHRPTLQQTLPMSPTAWRGSSAEGMRKDRGAKQLDDTKPPDDVIVRDCHRETARNDDHDSTTTTTTVLFSEMGEPPLADDESMAAPVHASSCSLSPDLSPSARFRGGTTRASANPSITSFAQHHDEEDAVCDVQQDISPLRGYRHGCTLSLSPEAIPVPSRLREGAALRYAARRGRLAFSRSPLSPRPFAVFRSKKREVSSKRATSHFSTAVHEPRARCGCRGVTVRVDSGPLGISLVSSYRVEGGLVLKRVWSDCDADSGAFRYSVEVKRRVRGDRDRHGRVGASDAECVERSASSGLVKIQTVGIECVANTSVAEPPLPLRPGVGAGSSLPGKKKARRVVLEAGVHEVEEGDILVRVDNVQVRLRWSGESHYCYYCGSVCSGRLNFRIPVSSTLMQYPACADV